MSDHSWGGLPEARVRRDGSRPVPRRVGRALRDYFTLGPRAQVVVAAVLGLWPLLLVTALAITLLWTAGLRGSP